MVAKVMVHGYMCSTVIWTIKHYAILQWSIRPFLSPANYMAITTMILVETCDQRVRVQPQNTL